MILNGDNKSSSSQINVNSVIVIVFISVFVFTHNLHTISSLKYTIAINVIPPIPLTYSVTVYIYTINSTIYRRSLGLQ